ncbi:MAG TPA: xanthine dehydrogenase family protein molybdopterin-binding subunit [Planctomycetota bacterium]|nr:xanthine dehydrogenase family protein molybdopterin-binding subunit [Planctomycetota bacterium]
MIVNLSRRDFLRTGALAGGGLLLGVHIPGLKPLAALAGQESSIRILNAFVRIGTDDIVTIIANHSEMGQGAYTSVAMVVAEELDADWSKIRVESAPVDPVYNHTVFGIQMTGGSTSTWSEWDRLRKAGASARRMLVEAAAAKWGVDPSGCQAVNGVVTSGGRTLTFGQLAEEASKREPPKEVALKDARNFKLIGKPAKRLDSPDKVTGKAVFGIDVKVPGMLVAVVARPPVFGGKLKSFNADKAKAMPGVRHVLDIGDKVAVIADGYWPALKGRDALEIEWDEGSLASLDTEAQGKEYAALAKKAGAVARKEGDPRAATTMEAIYDLPYLAHAAMEPLNCTADVRADSCEVWVGTQFQTADHAAAAQESGLKPEQVKLHTTLLGGGFGRRAVIDSHFVREAVRASKAVKAPVKVIWTREDDMKGGFYRPRAHHVVRGGLNSEGRIVAWQQRIVCQSFIAGTPFEPYIIKDGVDKTAVEGADELPYEIPNQLIDWHMAPGGVPTLWWRSVGHSHSAFAIESFMDELAHAAKKDPLEFRRAHMAKHPRVLKVLETAAEKAGWGKPLAKGRGRGLAVHESFGSIIAHVVEASVSEHGRVRAHRVTCAVDCGPVVNPDSVKAQMEGGVVFGLSAALFGEITFEKGRVQQSNFHDYPMLRMHEMPEVEVHLIPSTERMGGVGEPGVPPVAPALANAIFAATGKRIRRLPIRPEDFK